MGKQTTYTFNPIFGYGWRCGEDSIEVPSAFKLNVASESATNIDGEIQSPHEYGNHEAKLSLRTKVGDTRHYNVKIVTGGEDVTGFAEMVE